MGFWFINFLVDRLHLLICLNASFLHRQPGNGDRFLFVQRPPIFALRGGSAWLRVDHDHSVQRCFVEDEGWGDRKMIFFSMRSRHEKFPHSRLKLVRGSREYDLSSIHHDIPQKFDDSIFVMDDNTSKRITFSRAPCPLTGRSSLRFAQ